MTEQRDKQAASRQVYSYMKAFGAVAVVGLGLVANETDWLKDTPLEWFNRHAANDPQYTVDIKWPPLQTVPRTPLPGETITAETEAIPEPIVAPVEEPAQEVAVIVNNDGPGSMTQSPELPHRRMAEEQPELVANIPIPAELPEELQAQRAIERLMASEGKVPPSPVIREAITYASQYTGVDEMYLYRLAHAESTFRVAAFNRAGGGRGACGLYQFRGASTYLETIYKHDDKFPEEYRHLSNTVEQYRTKGTTGYRVKAGVDKDMVFKACFDPKFASVLAAFFTLDLKNAIENRVPLEGPLTHADLYIAHFLGINGGPRFLKAYVAEDKRDNHVSNYVGRSQRRANAGIFNNVRTVEDFYDFFVEKKGMTDSPFDLGEAQYSEYVTLPEEVPLPRRRPIETVRYGGPR
ncbi:MAG: hypothetical protein KJ667_08000 [Alphaproteobacteria bacterium]|nr:hypothetical protein [Alphaproteobacteria bacterium]